MGSDPISGLVSDPALQRLRWRCRRGMRELDRLLEGFVIQRYGTLSVEEKLRFAEILEFPDPDLHAYLLGKANPVDAELARLISTIREAASL